MSTYNLTSNDAGIQSAPLSLTRTGGYNGGNGNLDVRGSYGIYWESMVGSSTSARHLYFYSSSLYLQDNHGKDSGYSLRCVVR